MKNILPVKPPLFSGYPATGYMLSVLQCYDVVKDWLFNNYIQLFSASNNNIDFFDICIENCPFIDYNVVDKAFILSRISLIDYITDMIDRGFYVSFMVDTSFISVYDFKGLHDPMVYGYNSDKKELYIADHFRNGKFSFSHCSFEEMAAAVNVQASGIEDARFLRDYKVFRFFRFDDSLYKYKVHFEYDHINRYQFSIDRFRESLRDYMECTPTVNWHTRLSYVSEAEKKEHSFGLGCYDLLMKQIGWTWENRADFSGTRQSLYVEYSHKLMMISRIKYLSEKGLIKNSKTYEEIYGRFMQDSQILLMCYIKNIIKQTYTSGQKAQLCQKINELKKHEHAVIKKILMDI